MRTLQVSPVRPFVVYGGGIDCRLSLPALDITLDKSTYGRRAFPKARHFIFRHLPSAPDALEGASFSISVSFCAPRGGVRRRVICRWRFGESATVALEDGARIWAQLSRGRYE